jgi:N-acetylglutamate synthase-like GNAT family acetyltransferase
MIAYQQGTTLTEAVLAFQTLRSLGTYYPGFEFWLTNKVLPGILTGHDTLLLAKEHDRIVGVALGKRTEEETKLRAIRVDPVYRSRGIGIHLTERMLRKLDCDKPVCSVSQEMLDEFSRPFVNHFGFDLTRVEKGTYRPRKLEYVFNGSIGKESAL